MDIFGLTPIDAALSALGLNCSQELTEFLFLQTPVGLVAFAIGFLWSLWQSVQNGNFKYFAIFVFLSLIGILFFIIPKRQEPVVKSALEVYGTSTITAKFIKDAQTTERTMPWVLSFVGQMADMVNFGAINVLDQAFDSRIRFLSTSFGLQRLSLQANAFVHAPLPDVHLKEDLDGFIYAHYLPSLILYKNATHHINDTHHLWPGDERITAYYSAKEKGQWEDLQNDLKHLIVDPQAPWGKIKDLLNQIVSTQDNVEEQIVASLVRGQRKSQELLWCWIGGVLTSIPYLYGWANFCVYVGFPLIMLAVIIIRRMSLFLRYVETFLWVKSFYFTAAISYYLSIVAAKVQGQTQSQLNWFWDYPYFCMVACVFLFLMPILSWCAIHQGFQLVNNRN